MTVRVLYGKTKTYNNFFVCGNEHILGSTNKMDKPKISKIHCVYQALLRIQSLKQKLKNSIEQIIITISAQLISLLHFMDCTCQLLTLILYDYFSFRFRKNTWRKVYRPCQTKRVILKEKRLLHRT